MRHYPTNSAQAAGRIVSLTLLADGYLSRLELDALDRLDVPGRLGLARGELHAVLHGFCEDLLATSLVSGSGSCQLDSQTLGALMAEIDDPALRRQLLALCVDIVGADGHLADGESTVLTAAVDHWGLHRECLDVASPLAQLA